MKWIDFFREQRKTIFTDNMGTNDEQKIKRELSSKILSRLKENKPGETVPTKYNKLFAATETYTVRTGEEDENTIAVTWVRKNIFQIIPLFFDARQRRNYRDFFLFYFMNRSFPNQLCPICGEYKCTVEIRDKGREHNPPKFPNQEQAFLVAHCQCGEEAKEQEIRQLTIAHYSA
jgi:hypothetical protein